MVVRSDWVQAINPKDKFNWKLTVASGTLESIRRLDYNYPSNIWLSHDILQCTLTSLLYLPLVSHTVSVHIQLVSWWNLFSLIERHASIHRRLASKIEPVEDTKKQRINIDFVKFFGWSVGCCCANWNEIEMRDEKWIYWEKSVKVDAKNRRVVCKTRKSDIIMNFTFRQKPTCANNELLWV